MKKVTEDIDKVEIVPIRTAFPKEAGHFTKWLETNIEALSDRLKMSLSVIQREGPVGDFNVDLVCVDENKRRVIIENQLEKTDHDHLGKLLTYLVNLDGSSAIWITSDPRKEHEKVIDWLNESTPEGTSFYLVKVEGIRVGKSPVAPLFTVVTGPDKQIKEIGKKKKEWAEGERTRFEFWTELLEKSRPKTTLFANRAPAKDLWISTGAGRAGLSYTYVIWTDEAAVEFYIDFGDAAKNKAAFDKLHARKRIIEKKMGRKLSWDRLDEKRGSRLRAVIRGGGLNDKGGWMSLQNKMIACMMKLEATMKSEIQRL